VAQLLLACATRKSHALHPRLAVKLFPSEGPLRRVPLPTRYVPTTGFRMPLSVSRDSRTARGWPPRSSVGSRRFREQQRVIQQEAPKCRDAPPRAIATPTPVHPRMPQSRQRKEGILQQLRDPYCRKWMASVRSLQPPWTRRGQTEQRPPRGRLERQREQSIPQRMGARTSASLLPRYFQTSCSRYDSARTIIMDPLWDGRSGHWHSRTAVKMEISSPGPEHARDDNRQPSRILKPRERDEIPKK
jgi:hypothetical protein